MSDMLPAQGRVYTQLQLTLWLPRTWLLAPRRGTPRLAISSVVPGCVPAGILSSTGPSTVVTLTYTGTAARMVNKMLRDIICIDCHALMRVYMHHKCISSLSALQPKPQDTMPRSITPGSTACHSTTL